MGGIMLYKLRNAAMNGCIDARSSLQELRGTFLPHRPNRSTEACISEYEPDPGLQVYVGGGSTSNMPLYVTTHFQGMTSKTGSLLRELYFYSHAGL